MHVFSTPRDDPPGRMHLRHSVPVQRPARKHKRPRPPDLGVPRDRPPVVAPAVEADPARADDVHQHDVPEGERPRRGAGGRARRVKVRNAAAVPHDGGLLHRTVDGGVKARDLVGWVLGFWGFGVLGGWGWGWGWAGSQHAATHTTGM